MSKFEEMCEAVNAAAAEWREYRERSYRNIHRLAEGLREYCEIPRERIYFRPLDKDPEEGSIYNVIGATHYGSEDGYWHTGLCITLSPSGELPHPTALMRLALAERDGRVMVKRYDDDAPQMIDLENSAEREEFYESVVSLIKQNLCRGPQDLGKNASSVTIIGFRVDSKSED